MKRVLNDCFTTTDQLMRLGDALELLEMRLFPVVGTESVPLSKALGRVLAEEIAAGVDNPRFDSAAMDGFAVRYSDLKRTESTTMPIAGRVAAGHPLTGDVPSGSAVRIFTGAPLPAELDTVVMQEDCLVDGDRVRLPSGIAQGNFVRRTGEDFTAGAMVLAPGRRLRPQDLAMAAAVGKRTLTVHTPLKAGVFSTGDEIVEPGGTLGAGQIFGSNRYGLMAALQALGAEVSDLGHLPDDRRTIERALAEAGEHQDLILTSGGVSVGGEDHVVDAVRACGEVHLWRLAVKPGKPTTLGTVGRAAFVGLPGYPVSALVTFMVVARPVVLRLSGATAEPMMPAHYAVKADFAFEKKHRRRQFLRVALDSSDGPPLARLFRSQEPHVLSSLIESQGLVDVGEDVTAIAEGDTVPFIPYASFLPV